jgi:putative ABC transport system permease protein
MTKYLEPELRPWRLGATLFTAFGLLALLVAAVGVYGVIAYSFSQRTHELGIRTALGASVGDTYKLVLGEAMRLTMIGVAAGVLLALALGRLVASLLYATSAKDPLVIAAAAAVLLAVGTAASLLPAWRATKTDPMTVLRAE